MSDVVNFNAGPAALPAAVMQRAAESFTNYNGLGYGILEASHRSPEFTDVITRAESNLRALMAIPDDYAVMFVQGGASTQFAMVPMNLLADGASADYADTGSWSKKAIKEATLFGNVKTVFSGAECSYTEIADPATWSCSDDAAYLHVTSNNTIAGTQLTTFPTSNVPLVADMSSDILSRRLDVQQFAVIYAGAQKNLGPSGVTLVIMRRDLVSSSVRPLPTMLRYSTHVDANSLYNTPPTFSIYMVGLVLEWLLENGGLAAIEQINDNKAANLYGCIDADEFYRCPVVENSRSQMNVCFRLPTPELEALFLAESKQAGLIGLKGHRSVGGMRASIYNAVPAAGVQRLVDFMNEFRRTHG